MMRLISNVNVSSQKKDEKKKTFFLNHALVNMHVFVHILQKPSVNTKLYLKISTSYIFNLEENVVIKRKRKKNGHRSMKTFSHSADMCQIPSSSFSI